MTELNYTAKTWNPGDYLKASELGDLSKAVADTIAFTKEVKSVADSFNQLYSSMDKIVCAPQGENITDEAITAYRTAFNETKVIISGKVKKHQNGASQDGHWIGIGVVPDKCYGSDKVKNIHFNYDKNVPLPTPGESSNGQSHYVCGEVDKNVSGSESGQFWWFDAYSGSNDENNLGTVYVQYQWLDDNKKPLSPVLYLCVDLSNVQKK